VALSRTQIVDAAYDLLAAQGLAGLSMRRVAQNLGVQHGGLYYYVASKQELLAVVAERILAVPADWVPPADPWEAAAEIREMLLRVRDGAEVISFAHAFKPDSLGMFRELHRLFADLLPAARSRAAAQCLIHYILGFVAEEQNHAELVHARILDDDAHPTESAEAFRFGVRVILDGLQLPAHQPDPKS
jgi:AcrR family transcriptional regulator